MKKLMLTLFSIGLLAGSVKAACVLGKFCVDDNGAAISGVGYLNGNGYTVPTQNGAYLGVQNPNAAGQLVVISSAASSTNNNALCVSTTTVGPNAYVFVGSTGTVCK